MRFRKRSVSLILSFRFRIVFWVLVFSSLWTAVPGQEAKYVYNIPQPLSDGWKVSSLEAEDIEPQPIIEISARIRDIDDIDEVLSMAIVKRGKLVHEVYSPYVQRNTLHWLASITKTMTSTLIGIAIDKGFIPGVDARVIDLIPEYSNAVKDPRFNGIRLHHLMCMSSGLDWNEQVSYNDPRNSEWQMVESEDWIRFVLGRRVLHDPGTEFRYNTGGMHLLSAVIKAATGRSADRFAEEHLFHPMDIYAYQWNRDIRGYPSTGGVDGGLGLRTRDLAKIGWLFMGDGTWKGKRIISEKWTKQVTQKNRILKGANRQYSFNWTMGTGTINGKRYEYRATFGYGGQVLYMVPEHELLIVITCELAEGGGVSQVLLRRILQAAIE